MMQLEQRTHELLQRASREVSQHTLENEIAIRVATDMFVASQKGELDMDSEEIIGKAIGFASRLAAKLWIYERHIYFPTSQKS